jgi:hypothetical protein
MKIQPPKGNPPVKKGTPPPPVAVPKTTAQVKAVQIKKTNKC